MLVMMAVMGMAMFVPMAMIMSVRMVVVMIMVMMVTIAVMVVMAAMVMIVSMIVMVMRMTRIGHLMHFAGGQIGQDGLGARRTSAINAHVSLILRQMMPFPLPPFPGLPSVGRRIHIREF